MTFAWYTQDFSVRVFQGFFPLKFTEREISLAFCVKGISISHVEQNQNELQDCRLIEHSTFK